MGRGYRSYSRRRSTTSSRASSRGWRMPERGGQRTKARRRRRRRLKRQMIWVSPPCAEITRSRSRGPLTGKWFSVLLMWLSWPSELFNFLLVFITFLIPTQRIFFYFCMWHLKPTLIVLFLWVRGAIRCTFCQCCGSGMFMPDPRSASQNLSILTQKIVHKAPDPGSGSAKLHCIRYLFFIS
jgi:hypothetical protein